MKKLAAILLFLCYNTAVHAQTTPWVPFTVDATLTLQVPGKLQPVDVTRFEPNTPPSQVRGYRYTDAAGSYILMRLEKPLDRLYSTDSNPAFYDHQVDDLMRAMHGTLTEETLAMNGPYQARCVRYAVPSKGTYYLGVLLAHHVSYQFQYMPSKLLTKEQDTKVWAQFLHSIVNIR